MTMNRAIAFLLSREGLVASCPWSRLHGMYRCMLDNVCYLLPSTVIVLLGQTEHSEPLIDRCPRVTDEPTLNALLEQSHSPTPALRESRLLVEELGYGILKVKRRISLTITR